MAKDQSSENRTLWRDIVVVFWFAAALYLVLILGSYSPVDLQSLRISEFTRVLNLGGAWGVLLAKGLLFLFGFTAWALPFGCIGACLCCVSKDLRQSLLLKSVGFLILLLASCGLVSLLSSSISALQNHSYKATGFLGDTLVENLSGWLTGTEIFLFLVLLVGVGLMFITQLKPFGRPENPPKSRATSFSKRNEKRTASIEKSPATTEETQNIDPNSMVSSRTNKGSDMQPVYNKPSLELLKAPVHHSFSHEHEDTEGNVQIIESRLGEYGVNGNIVGIQPGPVVSTYELRLSSGIKVKQIIGLTDELAMGLKASAVRILAPIPGRDVVGIEVPNRERSTVFLREVLESQAYQQSKAHLPLALGKDILGNPFIEDLSRMSHLLVAGSTGSGKSVFINTLLLSLLYKVTPAELCLLLIDPKRLELSLYSKIPHLLQPVVTDPREAVKFLKQAVEEMDRRYQSMAENRVRNIAGFNRKMVEINSSMKLLPRLVIVIDEYASLMKRSGRDLEVLLTRLAQMGRAAGIHLVLATQRPSVDVVTGLLKANFPSRIAFKVFSQTDSRTILDQGGAERLLNHGDMLYLPCDSAIVRRLHGAWVSDVEVESITAFLRKQDHLSCHQDQDFGLLGSSIAVYPTSHRITA